MKVDFWSLRKTFAKFFRYKIQGLFNLMLYYEFYFLFSKKLSKILNCWWKKNFILFHYPSVQSKLQPWHTYEFSYIVSAYTQIYIQMKPFKMHGIQHNSFEDTMLKQCKFLIYFFGFVRWFFVAKNYEALEINFTFL